jgi:hypothetical protein
VTNRADERLKDFRVFYHGERSKTMLPQSREHYTHIMIEVTDDDPQPGPHRFSGQASIRWSAYVYPMRASCSSRFEAEQTQAPGSVAPHPHRIESTGGVTNWNPVRCSRNAIGQADRPRPSETVALLNRPLSGVRRIKLQVRKKLRPCGADNYKCAIPDWGSRRVAGAR